MGQMTVQPMAFEEDPPPVSLEQADERAFEESLLLRLEGFEGPIDVLLELARSQKVDLRHISILQLVRQYLVFIERAKEHNLDLAAEYLVMASWLAYLKSRLLLPKDNNEEEHNAEAIAEALQFQLRRLEAMQETAEKLEALPQLGRDIFRRGQPQRLSVRHSVTWDAGLYDVIKAYGDIQARNEDTGYDLPEFSLMSAEDAMERVKNMLGELPRIGMKTAWTTLESFLPERMRDKTYARSALASTFTAGLELAKQGQLEIRQEGLFKTIYLRALGELN